MALRVAIALAVVVSGSAQVPAHGSMSVTGAGKFRSESQGVVAPGEGEQRASMMRKERLVQPAALDEASADGIAPQVAIKLYNAINNGADAFQSVATTINQQAQEIQALNKVDTAMTGASAAGVTAASLFQASSRVGNDDTNPCAGGNDEASCAIRGKQGDHPRCEWSGGSCVGILCTAIAQEYEVCTENNMCRWDSSVSRCYQRDCKVLTTSGDPVNENWCDSSPSCHKAGDVCVQKPCAGMSQSLCGASEKDCMWHTGSSTCKAVRCNGLTTTGRSEGTCQHHAGCSVQGSRCVGCSALTSQGDCAASSGCSWNGSQCDEHCSHYTVAGDCISSLHPSCGWNENTNTCETDCSDSGARVSECAAADTDYCSDTDPSRSNAWMSATCKRDCRTCPVACHHLSSDHCGDHPSCLWKSNGNDGGACKKQCANFDLAAECAENDHCAWNAQLVPAVCVDKVEQGAR